MSRGQGKREGEGRGLRLQNQFELSRFKCLWHNKTLFRVLGLHKRALHLRRRKKTTSYWPLIGRDSSRDPDTGLWLVGYGWWHPLCPHLRSKWQVISPVLSDCEARPHPGERGVRVSETCHWLVETDHVTLILASDWWERCQGVRNKLYVEMARDPHEADTSHHLGRETDVCESRPRVKRGFKASTFSMDENIL